MTCPVQFASTIASEIREKTLDNGLKVICLKKAGAPIVSAQVWYKTGSSNEIDGIRGISHFFEHMMFRGSQKYGPEEHARKINDVGGHYNAFTAEDVTAYLNSVPRDYLDMVFSLEADRMTNLVINEQVLNTERNVILEEFQTYMNNPISKALLEFRKEFFVDHPYTYSALGKIDDIKKISVDDCMSYYRNWYTPANAVLVIVGDFDTCDIVFDKAQSVFGSISSSQNSHSIKPIATSKPYVPPLSSWMKRPVDFDVPICVIGYPAPSASDKDAMPLEILQMIMSQGESSRLHRDIVRNKSLAIMAGGMNQCLRLGGMTLFFAVFTPNVSQKKLEQAIVNHVNELAIKGISQKEIEKVKNVVLTNRMFELYSSEHICQKLGYAETIEGDYHLWVQRLNALEKLDIDTLKDAAKRYWNESVRHTLYLKPKKINPLLYAVGVFRKLFPQK